MGYRTHGKRYSPKQLVEFAALLDAADKLPAEPRKTTLSERIFETFPVYRDHLNEEHARETKGYRGRIWQGHVTSGQDRKAFAEFCENEGWSQVNDSDWHGKTGKGRLTDEGDVIFFAYEEATQ